MTLRGYKQTAAHIEKRKRVGREHHAWLGSDVPVRGGRTRAIRAYVDVGPCERCGNPKAERHHRDGNTAHNEAENIGILCRRCHMKADGRLDEFKESGRKNRAAANKARREASHRSSARPGDKCQRCGRRLSVVQTRKDFIRVGCRKSRGGCGLSAGSFLRDDHDAGLLQG